MKELSTDFTKKIINLLLGLEKYSSPYAKAIAQPHEIADELIKVAAWKATAISSSLSIIKGKLGLISILPELFTIYRIQSKLIKDISAVYGKESQATKESILYCLFGHSNWKAFQQIVLRTSACTIIRPASYEILFNLIYSTYLKLNIEKNYFKKFPFLFTIIGAGLSGSVTYIETIKIGKTAIEIFSKEVYTDS